MVPKGGSRRDTFAFVSTSSIIIFSLVVSISTNTETVKVMDKAATDGSFTVAQAGDQNRRDTRQGCRQQEGAGANKRNCKQEQR